MAQDAIGGEIDQVRFLGLDRGELLVERCLEIELPPMLLSHEGVHVRANLVRPARVESDGTVEALDCLLRVMERDVGRIADPLLPSSAEEVEVLRPLAERPGDDHAVAASLARTPAAEQRAAQVVGVLASSLVSGRPRLQHGLYAGEQLGLNERLVAPDEALALVRDKSEVIGVPQHPAHLLLTQGAGRAAAGAAGAQPPVVHLLGELDHRVLVRGAELEGLTHEWAALRIDDHRPDFAIVDPLADVEVAERSAGDGATLASLRRELVLDVGPVSGGPVLVEGGEDAVEHLPLGRFIDVLSGRDEGDTVTLELRHDEGVVEPVPVHAAELVDDDVRDVPLLADALEHLSERDPLGHLAARDPGLDVLVDDIEAELLCFPPAALALRWEGDALRVVVGFHLLRTRHPQVEHRTSRGRWSHHEGHLLVVYPAGRGNE